MPQFPYIVPIPAAPDGATPVSWLVEGRMRTCGRFDQKEAAITALRRKKVSHRTDEISFYALNIATRAGSF